MTWPIAARTRECHQNQTPRTRLAGNAQGVHIVPAFVGDLVKVKTLADRSMDRLAIYLQPINYPTVARGTERIRIALSPCHSASKSKQ